MHVELLQTRPLLCQTIHEKVTLKQYTHSHSDYILILSNEVKEGSINATYFVKMQDTISHVNNMLCRVKS